jgi:membrane-bound lytic murein transglycosylase D
VQKLRALSCLLEQADDREDGCVARSPGRASSTRRCCRQLKTLDAFAQARGLDAAQLRRFNPRSKAAASCRARMSRCACSRRCRWMMACASRWIAREPSRHPGRPPSSAKSWRRPRRSVRTPVARGESLSVIAHRYGVRTRELIALNKLDNGAKIRPGMVLRIDAEDTSGATAAGPEARRRHTCRPRRPAGAPHIGGSMGFLQANAR